MAKNDQFDRLTVTEALIDPNGNELTGDVGLLGAGLDMSTTQDIPAGTSTDLEFDVENFDDTDDYDPSAYQYSVEEGERLYAAVAVNFQNSQDWSTGDEIAVSFALDGAAASTARTPKVSTVQQTVSHPFGGLVVPSAGNITVQVTQNSGAAQTVENAGAIILKG